MKVALFGGTGFVGTHITEELINNHHDPVLLVRPDRKTKFTYLISAMLILEI